MRKLKIEWLTDSTECDQAGCSGGYAEGFRAELDGKLLAEFIPSASCFDSDSCNQDEAFKLIFKALDIELEMDY